MNNVVLVGRLTKDPELRVTGSGKSVASFTVAINRGFGKDKEADFINCVAWEKTAENLSQYTGKGSQIALSGRIQTRNYDDKDGKKVFVTEVVANMVEFIGSKDKQETRKPSELDSEFAELDLDDISDSDLPF